MRRGRRLDYLSWIKRNNKLGVVRVNIRLHLTPVVLNTALLLRLFFFLI